ncbi:hypothetical protein AB0K14_14060 [Actinosynnema sp. NPDC050801]|uniref:hypothetical protein n=1 Tax=unclassified Actinosynnema TaxID=2637065 RepID=UPI0033D60F01
MATDVERKWVKDNPKSGASLISELPEVGVVLDAALPRLESQGLITSNAGLTPFLSSPHTWKVTEYGQMCLKELAEVPNTDDHQELA